MCETQATVADSGLLETHIDADCGLWIPPQLRDVPGGASIRMPNSAIVRYTDDLGAYEPSITTNTFRFRADQAVEREHLLPNRVGIKPFGGDEVLLEVDLGSDDDSGLPPIQTPTCSVDGCETPVRGLDDGWEYDRGLVCSDCIDYQTRHGHWPDEEQEPCVECRIDAGAVDHECPEAPAFDGVLVPDGDECPHCGVVQRKQKRGET